MDLLIARVHRHQIMTSSKLHPIYQALESHQYSRAIKLCLAQPDSALLAKTLLAHAYAKSGQRYKALLALQTILGPDNCQRYFPELRIEMAYSLDRQQEPTKPAATTAPTPAKKIGKKGKKKGSSATTAATSRTNEVQTAVSQPPALEDWDLIDQLDTPPTLPDNWEELPPPQGAPTDETLLSTMAMTMGNLLGLKLTVFQLYGWASSKADNDEYLLRRAYLAGFAVLIAPQYQHLASPILANMQVLALQLSRVQQQLYGVAPATAWAAQTALWQVQYAATAAAAAAAAAADTSGNNINSDAQVKKEAQRLAMLPRLAESLALKCVQANNEASAAAEATAEDNNNDHLMETEDFLLYMRTLELQGKYEDQLKALDERLVDCKQSGTTMPAPPRQTLLDLQAQAFMRLKRYDEVRTILEELLRDHYPDDWRYWIKHLECGNETATMDLIQQVVAKEQPEQKYPLRGPHLMYVELAKRQAEKSPNDEDAVVKLSQSIQEYGNQFADRASCIYSDLEPYLDYLLSLTDLEGAKLLLQWVANKRSGLESNTNEEDPKCRRTKLRAYIFAVQVTYKVVTRFPELRNDELPDWRELIRMWKSFESESEEQAQKESRPADELVLLAAQQLLCAPNDTTKLVTAACVLEAGIRCSPYNAYLKITAMLVYGELNAVARAWELYSELHIKHIQHESCAYLILPLLQSGGFYRETISVCQEILRLQIAAIRDATEYIAHAMENGTTRKADELLLFHRRRMNRSLTTLEAKGLILDSAPMFVEDASQDSLGAVHGIVGGEFDVERTNQMVAEAHNPCAAFSLLRLNGSVEDLSSKFSENRDFSIFSHEILITREFDSLGQILENSLRRGHHHRLLIRAALCLELTKGPKKGKIAKSTHQQEKRCKSLLESVNDARILDDKYKNAHQAMHCICSSIAAFGAGVYLQDDLEEDSLESRETRIEAFLKKAAASLEQWRQGLSPLSDVSVSRLSRLIPDCVICFFALFRMCAKAADLYGWGPRKQKSKVCASAVAQLASKFSLLVSDILVSLERYVRWTDS